MRLIDADRLYLYDRGHLCKAMNDAIDLVQDEPTVEAIPIEWLKKWCGNEPYWCNLTIHLIEDWEKSKDASRQG